MAPVTATSEVSTTATAMPEVQGVSAGVSTRRGSQGWCSSADDADKHQGTGSFSQPPPPPVDLVPTTPLVTLPPGFQSLLAPRIPTTHSLASAQSTARCVFVRTTLSRVTEKMTTTVSTPGSQSCLPREADMLLSSLTFTQIGNRPQSSWNSCPIAFLVLLLVLISAAGDRVTSSRSSPGTLVLHVASIRVP